MKDDRRFAILPKGPNAPQTAIQLFAWFGGLAATLILGVIPRASMLLLALIAAGAFAIFLSMIWVTFVIHAKKKAAGKRTNKVVPGQRSP